MLISARKNLRGHAKICIFGRLDAASEAPFLHFDYCRINELLTDLPAKFYMKKDAGIMELVPQKGEVFSMNALSSPSPIVSSFLARIDDGRAIPFNFAAEKFILSLCTVAKPHSRMDIFDYGFYTADDVLSLPKEEWNRLLVRNYGGQLTVDLNFPQMLSSLSSSSVSAKIEKQKEYCEKTLGKKLEFTHTKAGLDYLPVKKDTGIQEDDGFYHLRIGR